MEAVARTGAAASSSSVRLGVRASPRYQTPTENATRGWFERVLHPSQVRYFTCLYCTGTADGSLFAQAPIAH